MEIIEEKYVTTVTYLGVLYIREEYVPNEFVSWFYECDRNVVDKSVHAELERAYLVNCI